MHYRTNKRNNDELSILGYGCMRYTKNGNTIDQEKAEREMKIALEAGVNYFDTAYMYAGCEVCLGKFVKKEQCREKIRIATKLPHYLVKKGEDLDRYFAEQLTRLQTDYVDYYLMHMLNDVNSFRRLCELGLKEWIEGKKASGQIKNIGFSFHGGTVAFKELLDAYDWDFCQIQYNYMDEHSQAGVEGLTYAHEKGLPVIIMEPLRGGRLVNGLPEDAKAEFAKTNPDRSPAEWGLRWIWNQKEPTVVLSGMNSSEQVTENCRIASEADVDTLTKEELDTYVRVLDVIHKKVKVGCTGCGYCQPCPKGVDIPTCFSVYNASYANSYWSTFAEYMMCTTLRKVRTNAGLCVKCGKCEQHCPQSLSIREELAKVRKRFEHPIYKIGAAGVKLFMKY